MSRQKRLVLICGAAFLAPAARAQTLESAWAAAQDGFMAARPAFAQAAEIEQPSPKPVAALSDDLAKIDAAYLSRHIGDALSSSNDSLKAMLAKDPENPDLLWRLGRGLNAWGARQPAKDEKLKVFKEAETALKASLAKRPEDAEARYWMGRTYAHQNEILRTLGLAKAMRRELEAAIRVNPRHAAAHRLLGELLRQLPGIVGGSARKAVEHLEKALELAPNDTANYAAMAEGYLAVDKKDKAIEALKKLALVRTPDDPAEYENDLKDVAALLKKLGA